MKLDVNTGDIIKFTKKLDELNRSALPIAIRSTLNEATFETKKNVPIEAASNFTIRNKSFFRSLTVVSKAGGFDINKMQSTVGISPARKSRIAENLEKQEYGGTIRNRSLIAMDQARSSGNNEKAVSAKNYLSKITFSKSKKKNSGTGFVMIKKGGKGTVFRVRKNGGKSNLTPLYTYVKNRSIKVDKKPFMLPASLKAQKLLPIIFVEQAERQIKKYLK